MATNKSITIIKTVSTAGIYRLNLATAMGISFNIVTNTQVTANNMIMNASNSSFTGDYTLSGAGDFASVKPLAAGTILKFTCFFDSTAQNTFNQTLYESLETEIATLKRDKANKSDLVDLVYPVGSIYMTLNTTSPQVLFGGEWTQIQNKFLLGAGTWAATGAEGGEKEHTLIENELPPHGHSVIASGNTGHIYSTNPGGGPTQGLVMQRATINGSEWISGPETWDAPYKICAGSTPNLKSFPVNNMPPYLAVYIWKRIK